MWSPGEGEAAVRLARWRVDAHVGRSQGDKPPLPRGFARPGRAFVTLNTHPDGALRGCIGYFESAVSLAEALERAAVASCHDPRFDPLGPADADGVVIEVSLLTPPELLPTARPLSYLDAVEVGVHGLLVRQGITSGLLLPQVAVEQDWASEDFLAQACMKAGLLPDAWFEPSVQVYRFEAEIFGELEPRGSVVRRVLSTIHDGHPG